MIEPMFAKLIRTLALLLFVAVGAAQAETPTRTCPDLSAAELRQSVEGTAQAFQEDAQRLNRSLSELETPKLKDLAKIQPDRAVQSLGEQANRVRELEWREGASALASGAASSLTKGWQGVKEVAPMSAQCLQRWTGQAPKVVENVPAPDLTEQAREVEVPEPTSAVPGVELGTEVVDNLRRTFMDRVMPQPNIQEVGPGFIDAVANAFPTAFRIIKYAVIWVVSTSIIVTILLIIILARLGYLLFSSKRSQKDLQ